MHREIPKEAGLESETGSGDMGNHLDPTSGL
jgi:hypothetical protein